VLHVSTSAARFFQQSGGPPAHKATDLVRPELRDELHAVLRRAFEDPEPHLSPFVRVAFNGKSRRTAVLAQRRLQANPAERRALVMFLDGGEVADDEPARARESTEEVQVLRENLRQAEYRFDLMRDDYYVTNEELRAANEELQSLNEEYRSTTEELETSKEELQSINEELQTVNSELKGKLEEVSRAHSDLENLMAATDVATLFLDLKGRIGRYTPQAQEIFNIKRRDLGRPIGDLTHNLVYDSLEQDVRNVLAGSIPIEREVRSREGRVFVERLRPYRTDGDGELGGVVITFIEVTAIKRVEAALRDSERKLEAELEVMRLLHRMTMAVATAGTMQDALDQVLVTTMELLGAQMGNVQLLDRGSQQLEIVAQRGFSAPFLKAFEHVGDKDQTSCGRVLQTRDTVCIEDVARDQAYAPYLVLAEEAGYRAVQSQPLIGKSGELVGVLSIHFREPRAFSERDRQMGDLVARQAADLIVSRAQQENMARLNEALGRRTSELEVSERQLSRKAAELLEQDRNKEAFLAALGHELRNPMTAIQNSLEVISGDNEQSERALLILKRQVQHMARLINDLLDITRINLGTLRIQRERVNLNQTVLAAVEPARRAAEARGLALTIDLPKDPTFVEADPERLSQMVGNLLSNALNYTDKGQITVSVSKDAAHASIAVKDTGIGVNPDHIPALFTPFQTAEPKRGGGLGMGLSLVKRLVELHGGQIEFRSDGPSSGSTVSFTLPLAQPGASAASPADFLVPAPRRILVVEDQHDVADMFAAMLQKMGQQVKVAYDGEAALEIALEQRPQIAFLDVAMPGMSGVELARRLRQTFPSPSKLTLVAFTGYGADNPLFKDNDFDHHLLKPPTMERIAALLNSLPEKQREQSK
jgi:two-component system, chemotaxis family, CheB/CheR fusion protein